MYKSRLRYHSALLGIATGGLDPFSSAISRTNITQASFMVSLTRTITLFKTKLPPKPPFIGRFSLTVLLSGSRSLSQDSSPVSLLSTSRASLTLRPAVGVARRSTDLSAFRQRRRPGINLSALQASNLLRETSSRRWWKTTVFHRNHDYLRF